MSDVIEAIRDSAAAIVPRDGGLARIRALRFTPPGYDPAVWREMGTLGWIGLLVPEAQGGSGLGMREQGALLEELGRGLAPEPLVHGALTAAVLAAVGDAMLPPVLAGEVFVPLAWQEDADGLDVPGTSFGERRFIPLPGRGGSAIVPVRDRTGMALYEMALDGGAVAGTQDGGFVGSLRPDLAQARRLDGEAGEAVINALDDAALGTGFYLLGVSERAFAMTLDYLRTRHQFGRPLGSFQALQHRAADLKIALALTRASLNSAAATLDAGGWRAARWSAVARAKAKAASTALLVTRACVQLHGAIGYTDEYDVGLFLRKAMAVANQYGSARAHRNRFAAVAVGLAHAAPE